MKRKSKQREQKRRNSFKKNVKHFNDRKNRSKTRQLLAREDYDALSTSDQAKREDVWAWD